METSIASSDSRSSGIDRERVWSAPVAFHMNGIGDAILALPTLRAIAERLGPFRLITDPRADVFHGLELTGVIPGRRITHVNGVRVAHGPELDWPHIAARTGSCDLFLSIVPWTSRDFARLLRTLRPSLSVGFARCCDIRVKFDYDSHWARATFAIVQRLWPDAVFEKYLGPPGLPERASRAGKAVFDELPPGVKVLTVHSETSAEKQWPAASFSAAITAFLRTHPDWVCMLVDTDDVGIRTPTVEARVFRMFDAVERSGAGVRVRRYLPLSVAQAVIAQSHLFLGIDSCHLHFADLAGVPAVALFGPTSAAQWGCLVTRHRTFQGAGSTTEIAVDAVADALTQLA